MGDSQEARIRCEMEDASATARPGCWVPETGRAGPSGTRHLVAQSLYPPWTGSEEEGTLRWAPCAANSKNSAGLHTILGENCFDHHHGSSVGATGRAYHSALWMGWTDDPGAAPY